MSSILKVDQIQLSNGNTPTMADLGLNDTGSILQVVSFTKTGTVHVNSSSWTNMYSVSITPKSNTSKMFIVAHIGGVYMNANGSSNQTNWRISRDGGDVTGHNTHFHTEVGRNQTSAGTRSFPAMSIVDEPATTSSTTYYVQAEIHTGSGSTMINDTAGTSTITVLEIAG